jgi:uncharacterized protein YndB with AHSA1/START domain
MASYDFETVWRIRAPIARVWEAIVRSEDWPRWWRGVEKVEVLSRGDENGVGSKQRYTWRSRLPYTLAFDMEVVRVEPMSLIEGHATGELEGRGVWKLGEDGGVTTVRYAWQVRTTRWWMNLLTPLARPAFAWNHDYVMKNGAEGLARLLDAELVQR